MDLGYIDIVFLVVIGFFAFLGFRNGFICEISRIFGLVLGVFVGSRYAVEAGQYFRDNIYNLNSPTFDTFIGFIAIFLGFYLISYVFSWILSRFFHLVFSKYVDKLLGALFGGIKAFIALAVLLHFAFKPDFMNGIANHFDKYSPTLYSVMNGIASTLVKIDYAKYIPQDNEKILQKMDEVKDEVVEKAKVVGEEIQKTIGDSVKEQKADEVIEKAKTLGEGIQKAVEGNVKGQKQEVESPTQGQ